MQKWKSHLYSLINMRQLQIFSNKPKLDMSLFAYFCILPHFSLNLPELNLKLFWTSEENNFRFSSGKFGAKHRNQQTITCQVLAELNKIWSCLIFIKLYVVLVYKTFGFCKELPVSLVKVSAGFSLSFSHLCCTRKWSWHTATKIHQRGSFLILFIFRLLSGAK